MCQQGCCEKIIPANSARSFSGPAPILKKPRVSEILGGPPRRILEIGPGNLRNADCLSANGHKVDVIELATTMERYADAYSKFRRRGGKVRAWGRGAHYQGLSTSYDVVILTYVLETVCDPDVRAQLLRLAAKRLTSGGCALISVRGRKDVVAAGVSGVPCSDGFYTSSRTFIRGFNLREVGRLAKAAGFGRVESLHRKTVVAPELLHVIARI